MQVVLRSTKRTPQRPRSDSLPLLGQNKHLVRSLWRTWHVRTLCAILLLACLGAPFIVQGTLLYLQTGSPVVMDYSWYTFAAAGKRLHANNPIKLPFNKVERCRYPDLPPLGWITDAEAEEIKSLQGGKRIKVDIVLKGPRPFTVPSDSPPPCPASNNDPFACEGSQVVLPFDDATLFPYFWDAILGDGYQLPQQRPLHRIFLDYNIEFEVRPDWRDVEGDRPNSPKNVLIVGDSADAVATFASTQLKRSAAMLALATETCNTAGYIITEALVPFGFMTYGDCAVVDDTRYHVWPLGPKISRSQSARVDLSLNPTMAERKYLLNMMTSYTKHKPTRMQAWLAAKALCAPDPSQCYLQQTDMLPKILGGMVGSEMKDKLLRRRRDNYHAVLWQSKLTLCPSGNNPEQYRIWEAIMAGSIPVLEVPPMEPGTFYHPNYPTEWSCLPSQFHRLLKDLGAPVYYVSDWREDLPKLLAGLTDEELQARQDRLRQWYQDFVQHLRRLVFKMVRTHFEPE